MNVRLQKSDSCGKKNLINEVGSLRIIANLYTKFQVMCQLSALVKAQKSIIFFLGVELRHERNLHNPLLLNFPDYVINHGGLELRFKASNTNKTIEY